MEAYEAIQKRRSVSRYMETPVSDEILDEIIRAGLYAPSGFNLQPWYYVVVRSEEKKEELLSIINGASENRSIEGETVTDFMVSASAFDSQDFVMTLQTASAVVLVFMYTNDYTDRQTALMGIAASVQNILIAARSRGVATCWFIDGVEETLCKKIQNQFAGGKGDLISVITIGYAENWPRQTPQKIDRIQYV